MVTMTMRMVLLLLLPLPSIASPTVGPKELSQQLKLVNMTLAHSTKKQQSGKDSVIEGATFIHCQLRP